MEKTTSAVSSFRLMLARGWVGIYIIWLRDFKVFWRDTPRRIGAFAQPLLYLFLLGTGLQAAFNTFGSGGTRYVTFMYPGIIGMTVLFTSVFSAISIIWDRQFGFLKEVLVAPIPRTSVALGKILGGGTTAFLQGLVLLLLMPLMGVGGISLYKILMTVLIIAIMSLGMTALGVAIAARLRSFEGFPIIMNFLLMPLLFLSGAMFPLQGLPGWMKVLTRLDPLTYGVDALRGVILSGANVAGPSGLPQQTAGGALQVQSYPLALDLLVILGLGAALTVIAVWRFRGVE
ncbi:MAG: ABC transporter permease [Candidatus Geothermincolia bacterium]